MSGLRKFCWLIAALLAVAGCNVAESYRISMAPTADGETSAGGPPPCVSETGYYSLSMTTWSFKIKQIPGAGEPYFISELAPERHADPRFTYCLDYLANILADDSLSVGYSQDANIGTPTAAATRASGLLSYVASFAVDQSAEVARKLIKAIFIVLSRDPGFTGRFADPGTGEPITKGAYELDPLNPEEVAAINERIKLFGFCLVLDDYTYDSGGASVDAYCNAPQRVVRQHPSQDLAGLREQRWLKQKPERGGILYRPRLPYQLSVYTKDDPSGPERWALRETKTVNLENLSPIISMNLSRAAFAKSRVGLEFDAGVLTNFCVSKSSAVSSFIEIPLEIVYGLVALPSTTIRAEISRANETKDLVAAQTKLIAAQQQFLQFQQGTPGVGPPVAANGGPINGTTGCAGSNVAHCPGAYGKPTTPTYLPTVCENITVAPTP
jgi:hypothetical protein